MAAGNKRISELATASPLLTSDEIVIQRGGVPPNFKASIQQILDFAAAGSGTARAIPKWVDAAGNLDDSSLSQKIGGNNIHVNEGLSGATANSDFDDFVVESNVDGGMTVLVGTNNRFGGFNVEGSNGASADFLYDTGTKILEIATHDVGGTISFNTDISNSAMKLHADQSATIGGTTHLMNQGEADLLLRGSSGGALILGARAVPTADASNGKLYTLDAIALSWMEGGGSIHIVAFVGDPPSAHTIASHSDTSATGANLNTLVGGGVTGLHRHSTLSASDGDPADVVSVDNGSIVTITGTLLVSGTAVSLSSANVGFSNVLTVSNTDNTNNSSDAVIHIITTLSTGGNPIAMWAVAATQTYLMGIDNLDLDKFVGSIGTVLGISNWLEVDTSGNVVLAKNGVLSVGTGLIQITTSAGLLRHQAIDPAIAGTNITNTSGVLSVHAQSHTVASHSDTSATGAELNTLTNGSNADALHTHSLISAGALTLGGDSSTRGILTLWDGSGGDEASYINLYSRNGTLRTLWIEDDGTLKLHIKAPVDNADGVIVGVQT